jgi:predicted nuclease of predicted toxin-antitoxin system
MKFKVDENLPAEIALRLQWAGHDARTVAQQQMIGGSDTRLADVSRGEDRALVTLDLDFSDIRAYPPDQYPGLIIVRVVKQDKPHLLQVFEHVVALLDHEPLSKHLWIVDEIGVRIRGRESPPDR